ncbi:MAG TPA: hypothetical protein VJN90_02450 [Candidatus Acidoferrales bacterium]|nr:hypothetical protein [Candidatus Acidoferrales bacterium]
MCETRVRRSVLALAALGFFIFSAAFAPRTQAQQNPPSAQASASPPPAANAADVATPDAILAALYDVISGPATKKRDWNRFRSLFLPDARLIPTRLNPAGGETARSLSPDDYASRAAGYFEKNGFSEKEVARKSERFGGIMQVFSTYESRHDAADPKPFARGVNSIQLFFDGARWWVVTIFWQEENPSMPLPKEFQPAAR